MWHVHWSYRDAAHVGGCGDGGGHDGDGDGDVDDDDDDGGGGGGCNVVAAAVVLLTVKVVEFDGGWVFVGAGDVCITGVHTVCCGDGGMTLFIQFNSITPFTNEGVLLCTLPAVPPETLCFTECRA